MNERWYLPPNRSSILASIGSIWTWGFSRTELHRRPGPTAGTKGLRAEVQRHSREMGDGREEFFSVSVALNPYTVEAYCRESPQRKQFLGVGTGYMAGGGRKRLGTHRRRRLLQSDPQVSGQISSRGSKAGTGRGLARVTVCWGPDRPMLVDERYIGKTLSLGAGWMECVEGETWCLDGVRFRCRYEQFSHRMGMLIDPGWVTACLGVGMEEVNQHEVSRS
ncbi:hypothetical protein LY78DRAFT_662995 [Colletotrichum sublineola]|nr:hypothetical protein LY78DRAFT_662995 [Colletotrichum sublineola]